jgi:hypothetical protein
MIKIIVFIIFAIIYYYYYKHQSVEKFNLKCNDEPYDFLDKKSIIDRHLNKINKDQSQKYIYKSESLIPYNYLNNIDNNLVYNLNNKKRNRIMKLEKQTIGKINPYNSRLLTKNFNSNLDKFYTDHETPMMYKNNCKNQLTHDKILCSVNLTDIKLLGRYTKDKLHLNWNLPTNCSDIKNIFLFYKQNNDKKYEYINITYNQEYDKKYKNKGRLIAYINKYRINYNYYFKLKHKYMAYIYINTTNNTIIKSNVFKLD